MKSLKSATTSSPTVIPVIACGQAGKGRQREGGQRAGQRTSVIRRSRKPQHGSNANSNSHTCGHSAPSRVHYHGEEKRGKRRQTQKLRQKATGGGNGNARKRYDPKKRRQKAGNDGAAHRRSLCRWLHRIWCPIRLLLRALLRLTMIRILTIPYLPTHPQMAFLWLTRLIPRHHWILVSRCFSLLRRYMLVTPFNPNGSGPVASAPVHTRFVACSYELELVETRCSYALLFARGYG